MSTITKDEVDDSDLEDLLSGQTDGGSESDVSNGGGLEQAPLDLDHLTKGQIDVSTPSKKSSLRNNTDPFACCSYVSGWCTYFCYVYPKLSTVFVVGFIVMVMFSVANTLFNPTETFGVIEGDYSHISSEYDLTLGKIDHWCLKGDDDSCRCDDPLDPLPRSEFKTWVSAHKENKKLTKAYEDSDLLDVAFLGESLVEEMDGRWMGRPQGGELKGVEKIFKKHFKRENSGIEGVALGIAGDTSPNVLWRLLHGEMAENFNPRIWWVNLGMNDLSRMQCSEEVVVIGILRVVEEIRTRKPDAKIVINSMLPMADLRGGLYPHIADYKDAFPGKYRGKPSVVRGGIDDNPTLRVSDQKVATKKFDSKVMYSRPKQTTEAIHDRLKKRAKEHEEFVKNAKNARGKSSGTSTLSTTGKRPPSAGMPGQAKAKPAPRKESGGKNGRGGGGDKQRQRRELWKKNVNGGGGDSGGEKPTDKKEAKAEQKYLKKIKKDPKNPKIDWKKNQVKARDPRSFFLRHSSKLPLWTSIHAINDKLREFADGQDHHVHFFDATSIFAERLQGSAFTLQTDMISIRGHPTEEGFNKWEEAMAEKLKKLLEKDDEELQASMKAAQSKATKDDEDKMPDDDVQKDDDGED